MSPEVKKSTSILHPGAFDQRAWGHLSVYASLFSKMLILQGSEGPDGLAAGGGGGRGGGGQSWN